MKKKKDGRMVESPILEDQMKQPERTQRGNQRSNIPSIVGSFTFHHWRSMMGTPSVWNGANHVPYNAKILGSILPSYCPIIKN